MSEYDPVKVEIYLDDQPEPIGVYRPPASFELDTTKLPDGPHRVLIKATDRSGVEGRREVRFTVRNGPGIAVVGLSDGDVVEGKIPVLVNAYAGTFEEQWEPRRAETPAPIPTWSWVLFLLVVAWAMFYWAVSWTPAEPYATSPTFSPPETISAAALGGKESSGTTRGVAGFDWAELGAAVYQQRCETCHTASGEGVPTFVPSLRASTIVLDDDPTEHIRRVLFGSSGIERPTPGKWNAWMPPFGQELTDEEVAAVVNHERTSWGNNGSVIQPEQVRTVRQKE